MLFLGTLPIQVTELKLKVDNVERERDFYFDKLRDIEILCQMPLLQSIPVSQLHVLGCSIAKCQARTAVTMHDNADRVCCHRSDEHALPEVHVCWRQLLFSVSKTAKLEGIWHVITTGILLRRL